MEWLNSLEYSLVSAYWNSIDFLYVAVQNLWAYDFMSKAISLNDFLRENDYMFAYELLSQIISQVCSLELAISVFYDAHIKETWIAFNSHDEYLYNYLSVIDYTLCLVYNPELHYVREIESNDVFLNFAVNFRSFLYSNVKNYSLDIPMAIIIQLYLLVFFIFIFLSFFFSFFNNANKEEWAADTDYALTNVSIECEKEIVAIDDAMYLILTLIFFFGAYFGFIAFGLGFNVNDASFFFWALPVFVGALIFMPLNLLYDFGLLFPLYLRGSSNTSSFFAELVYDLIGIIAFFTRLVVQFVRIILMVVVYCMMHDMVILQEISHCFVPLSDDLFDDILNLKFNAYSISYFLLLVVPSHFMHWGYEVFHTFFVVTAQFAAFFTIAIWLFLLFYTFFVYEQYEKHFSNLRATREEMYKEYELLCNKNKLNK